MLISTPVQEYLFIQSVKKARIKAQSNLSESVLDLKFIKFE
jgi:hypothetical protein